MNQEPEATGARAVTFRHVLLPLDGSRFALAARPTAEALAARFGAVLGTISVATDERQMRRLQRGASAHVVRADDAASAIVERAFELGSCLVCMSTRGRGRVTGAVIGSVARAVLQGSNSPVVAVGPAADRPPYLVGRPRRRPRSWPEPLSIPRLAACVDGSETSESVLPVAAAWSATLNMQLAIVTVADVAVRDLGRAAQNRFGPPDPLEYVEQLANGWRERGADAVGEVVFDPISVAAGVAADVRAHPAGLLALTTSSRSGLHRVRVGAVAADIVRSAPAPALVVPVQA